jgi:electron transfer flavoprotein-quinone oxidoreductase
LAQAGVKVLLLERGPYPGSKNMSGGAVFSLPTREILPEFWQDAPVERALIDQQYWLLTETSAVKLGFASTDLGGPPYNKFSVMRATFDRWYAAKAVGAGADLWTSCKAEGLFMDGNRVQGVYASGRENGLISADLVILAQGVNPILAEKAGLMKKPKAQNCSLYVKEMIYLPAEIINERFLVSPGQGAVIGLIGDNNAGLIGTGSIYTFNEHVTINTGASVAMLTEKKVNPGMLLARLKQHPLVEPLLRGGTTVEYLAHMIPEGGYNAVPELVFNGLMITGDAAGLVNGTHGLSLAMYSGRFAAEAALEALAKGDYSKKGLRPYVEKLQNSFVLKDLQDNRKVPGWYNANPTLFKDYIRLLNQAALQASIVYPVSRREKRRLILKEILAARPVRKLVIDAFNAIRVVR